MLSAWVPYFFLKLPREDKEADHNHHLKKLISMCMEGSQTGVKL